MRWDQGPGARIEEYAEQVKAFALSIGILVVVTIAVSATWLTRRHLACKRRSAAFSQQIADIRRGADEELKVGASKADVTHFFEKRGIQVFVTNSEARGTLYRTGIAECGTIVCSTDEALIGVRVKLSPEGQVAEEPQVVSVYTDCL